MGDFNIQGKQKETMKDNQGYGGIVIRIRHSVFCNGAVGRCSNRLDNQTDLYWTFRDRLRLHEAVNC